MDTILFDEDFSIKRVFHLCIIEQMSRRKIIPQCFHKRFTGEPGIQLGMAEMESGKTKKANHANPHGRKRDIIYEWQHTGTYP
jgi:hypothetical protein